MRHLRRHHRCGINTPHRLSVELLEERRLLSAGSAVTLLGLPVPLLPAAVVSTTTATTPLLGAVLTDLTAPVHSQTTGAANLLLGAAEPSLSPGVQVGVSVNFGAVLRLDAGLTPESGSILGAGIHVGLPTGNSAAPAVGPGSDTSDVSLGADLGGNVVGSITVHEAGQPPTAPASHDQVPSHTSSQSSPIDLFPLSARAVNGSPQPSAAVPLTPAARLGPTVHVAGSGLFVSAPSSRPAVVDGPGLSQDSDGPGALSRELEDPALLHDVAVWGQGAIAPEEALPGAVPVLPEVELPIIPAEAAAPAPAASDPLAGIDLPTPQGSGPAGSFQPFALASLEQEWHGLLAQAEHTGWHLAGLLGRLAGTPWFVAGGLLALGCELYRRRLRRLAKRPLLAGGAGEDLAWFPSLGLPGPGDKDD
jgi:hypothetical protein